MKKSLSYIDETISGHDKRIFVLESELGRVKEQLEDANSARNNAEQYSRRYCNEIHGMYVEVPSFENIVDQVTKVGRAIGIDVNPRDIDHCHTLPRKNLGFPVIMVKWKSQFMAQSFLQASRKLKNITQTDFGLHTSSLNIH